MSEAPPPTFSAPETIESPEVAQTLTDQHNAIQDGILYRTFACISTLDPNELDVQSSAINFAILQKSGEFFGYKTAKQTKNH